MDHQKSNFSLIYGTLSDGGCWGRVRSKKFQTVGQAQISTTQEATEHQFLVDLSKHLVKPGLYFMSKPNGWPCSVPQSNIYFFKDTICVGCKIHEFWMISWWIFSSPLKFNNFKSLLSPDATIKFIYSEKATKFEEISLLVLDYHHSFDGYILTN